MNKRTKKKIYKNYNPYLRGRLISKSVEPIDQKHLPSTARFSIDQVSTRQPKTNPSHPSIHFQSQTGKPQAARCKSSHNLNITFFTKTQENWFSSTLLHNFEQTLDPHTRIESCKIIRKWVKLAPHKFPQELCAALVALADSEQDDLQEFSQELLRLLSIKNCSLVSRCGGLQVLIKALVSSSCSQSLNENLALTFSFLLNEAQTRDYFNNGREILRIFAVFVDPAGVSRNQKEIVVKNIRTALVLMVRSWAGLIYLTSNGLRTLLQSLTQSIENWIKEEILDMLIEMLDVQTDSASASFNLINNYLAMLLKALLTAGLTQVLFRVLHSDYKAEKALKAKALKLAAVLAELLQDLLPEADSAFTAKYLNLNSKPTSLQSLPGQCFLIEAISFIREKSQLNSVKNSHNEFFDEYVKNQFDDPALARLIHQSKVHKPAKKWNWQVIQTLLSGPLEQDTKFHQSASLAFVHSLISYFTLSKNQFHLLPFHPLHFAKARAGRTLVELLLSKEEGCLMLNSSFSEGFFQTRKSFLHELSEAIDEEFKFVESKEDGSFRVFSSEKVKYCMARECFLWIGIFLKCRQGRKLLKANKIIAKLMSSHLIEHLAVLVLSFVDLDKEKWRWYLAMLLNSHDFIRLKALECIRGVFREGKKDLCWTLEYLKSQLVSKNCLVVKTTLALLQEITVEKENLVGLARLGAQELLRLGKAGKKVLMNFFSFEEGLEYLSSIDYIKDNVKAWHLSLNTNYARAIELQIEKGLEGQKPDHWVQISLPTALQSRKQISWVSKLPFVISVRTEKGRTMELDPVIKPTLNGVQVMGLAKPGFYIHEGLSASLSMGLIHFDKQGHLLQEELFVSCPKDLQNQDLVFRQDGVSFNFVFKSRAELSSVSFFIKLFDNSYKSSKTIQHFFGELSKTHSGLEELRKSGIISDYISKLTSQSSTLQKRSCLWALGHIGSHDLGAQELVGLNLIEILVKIAEESSILSLRGTAFQALALICRSQVGRNEVQRFAWSCSGPALIALPNDEDVLFRIPNSHDFLPYMQNIESVDQVLASNWRSKAEEEIMDLIVGLESIFNRSKCEASLRSIRRLSPGLFLSQRLHTSVIAILSGYKFSLNTRIFVHRLFDIMPLASLEEFDAYQYIFNN